MKKLLRSRVTTQEIEMTMDVLDKDNSGEITLKEFQAELRSYFKKYPYMVKKKRVKESEDPECAEMINVKAEWRFFVDSFYEFYY